MTRSLQIRRYLTVLSLLAGAGAGGLAACSAGPELRIDQAPVGAVVLNGAGFIAEGSDPRAVVALRTALEAASVAQGEDWQIVAALAVRPVSVGTFTDTDAREGEWAETPRARGARRGPSLHVLTVVATRQDGTDRRVVRVSGRGPEAETPDSLLALLADKAVSALISGRAAADVEPSPQA